MASPSRARAGLPHAARPAILYAAYRAEAQTTAPVARRSGDAWFVASMSDEETRTLELPLDFLGEGTYEATVWMGAPEAPDYTRALGTR